MSEEKIIPMKVVKERTGLTSRQIRYYDEVDLIFPERSSGNQRIFSEDDIKLLKEIKKLINEGYNITLIKEKLNLTKPVREVQDDSKTLNSKRVDKRSNKGNKLSSLYPVSNRSYLKKVLNKKK